MNSQRANEAMDKIRDEMAGSQNTVVQQIGELLTVVLTIDGQYSEQILAKGKTLKGAADHASAYALKHKEKGATMHETSKKEDAMLMEEYWGIPKEVFYQAFARMWADICAETQAHAETTTLPPYGGSSPCTGEPMAGLISPVARGGHGGISAAAAAAATSMLDDFDALLGGL